MADDFELINTRLHDFAQELIDGGVKPDDVSGPMMHQSIALLIAADGAKATAKHLRDLARAIDEGEYDGRH